LFGGIGGDGQIFVPAPASGLVDRHRGHRREVGLGHGEIDIARADRHAVPGLVDQPGDRGKGHLLGHRQHQRLEQQGEAGELTEPVGLDLDDPLVGQLDPRGSHLEVAFVLEEVEVAQPLGLGVMDPMLLFHPRCGKPAAGDKVDADGQDFARRQNQHPAHTTVWQCRGRLQTAGSASRALASIAECRTMPAFSNVRLSGPVGAVKGSLRRASLALDRAHRTLSPDPNPLRFQKRPSAGGSRPIYYAWFTRVFDLPILVHSSTNHIPWQLKGLSPWPSVAVQSL
jgi:hypothetical protein